MDQDSASDPLPEADPELDALRHRRLVEELAQLKQRFAHRTAELERVNKELRRTDFTVENSQDAIFWVHPDASFHYVNRAACRLTGYSKDELLAMSVIDLDAKMDPNAWPEFWQLRIQSDDVLLMERPLRKKNGQIIAVEISPTHLQFDHQDFVCVFMRDISQRRQTEQRLRITSQAIESAAAGIAFSDFDGIITYVNPAFARMWGYESSAEIIGRPNSEFSSSEDDLGDVMAALHERGSWVGERIAKKKDGTSFPIEVAASLVRSADGESICFMGSFVDITRRRESEEGLRREHEFTENLINTAPNIVLVLDRDGAIVRFNPYLEKLSGWRLQEVVGTDCFETFVPEQDRGRARNLFAGALRGELTPSIVNTILTRDGRQRETEWFWERLTDDRGDVIGLLCTGQDITERKALERHILHIAGEEKRRIGQDLHDGVGQQLTGLGMMADTLLTALRRKSLPESEFAEKLAVGLKKAVGEVRQLARGLNPVEVDPQGLRSALVELSQRAEDLYGIPCSFQCNACLLLRDSETSTQLYRIAQEAINNAAKHSKATGIQVSLKKSGDVIELKVADNGTGISDRTREGIGLRSMGYRAGVIGGRLRIEPAVGGGTVVVCSLPASPFD